MLVVKTKAGSPQDLRNRLVSVPKFLRIENFRPGMISHARKLSSRLDNIFIVIYDSEIDHQKEIQNIKSKLQVEYVEPIFLRKMQYQPGDPLKSQQWHLDNIEAYKGWDVVRDARDIIIAIVDSGVELNHSDLKDQIYTNDDEIPDNGIDDDEDGYIDNYLGWDFVGASISDIIDAGAPVNWADWEDNNPNTSGSDHGTHVAGIASASFDNGVGIAGIAAGAKIMALKCGEDAGGDYSTSILRGYDAIAYAAEQGAHIINCSWGGPGFSQFEQDVINYATELGSLVVAAASNDGNDELSYPASYDNVLSVANVNVEDRKNFSSTYNYQVDVSAPGTDIYSSVFNGQYGTKTGTSMSSPVVAGMAALVKKRYPSYSPSQIAEQIRITSDDISENTGGFSNELGKGRVNLFRALTEKSAAIRVTDFDINNSNLQAGDIVTLDLEFTNYLEPISGLEVSIVESNNHVELINSSSIIGSLGTNSSTRIDDQLSFKISDTAPENLKILLRFEISSPSGFMDWDSYTLVANRSIVNVYTDEISTTIASNGRLGYLQPSQEPLGLGFIYNNENLLYELGFLASNGTILNSSVRSDAGNIDNDFKKDVKAYLIDDDEIRKSAIHVTGTFDDTGADTPLGLNYTYNIYAWESPEINEFIIVEYEIENSSVSDISNYYAGLYSDWDVGDDPANNLAEFDNQRKMGLISSQNGSIYAGIAPLTNLGEANYLIVDNADFTFSSQNNINGLTGGLQNSVISSPSDVSGFIGLGPLSIPAGEKIKIAFFVGGALGSEGMLSSYDTADYLYNTTLSIERVPSESFDVCYGTSEDISMDGFSSVRWYDSFEGGTLLGENEIYSTGNLVDDKVVYVSNVVGEDESVRTPIYLNVLPKNDVSTPDGNVICDGVAIELIASEGDEYLWSNGAITRSIIVTTPGDYSVSVTDTNSGCSSDSELITIGASTTPSTPSVVSISGFCLGDDVTLSVENPDESLEYFWSGPFGFEKSGSMIQIESFDSFNVGTYSVTANDGGCQSGESSLVVEPLLLKPEVQQNISELTVDVVGDAYQWKLNGIDVSGATSATFSPTQTGFYTVAVTSGGCTVISEELFYVVLNLNEDDEEFLIYPNPFIDNLMLNLTEQRAEVRLFDTSGREYLTNLRRYNGKVLLNGSELASGVYFVRIVSGDNVKSIKVIKR
ncbi:S8 family serine peptidase [Ekhidna sp.]|uniref:S8 family serine peptidase n=1 Tax=Ekhidna sp. TaxID=2608089 RepID=UPI003512B5B5